MSFPGGSAVNNSPANEGDAIAIPRSGRSPGEGNSDPLQYSCLGNPMDRGAWCGYSPCGHKRVGHDSVTKQQQYHSSPCFFVCLFCKMQLLCIKKMLTQ